MHIEPFCQNSFIVVSQDEIILSSDLTINSADDYIMAVAYFKKIALLKDNWHVRHLNPKRTIIELFDHKGRKVVSGMTTPNQAHELINKIINHYAN